MYIETDPIHLTLINVINLTTTDVINQDLAETPAIMHLHLLSLCWLYNNNMQPDDVITTKHTENINQS